MDTVTLSTALDPPAGQDVVAPISPWPAAGVAFSIAFVAGLIGLGFETPVLLIGIPAATVAGWFLGPKIPPIGGLAGVVVPSTVTSASSSYGASDPLSAVTSGLALWGIGLVFVGIPMLIVTVPCGFVWAVLVRRLAGRAR